jgi:hypothetical protein
MLWVLSVDLVGSMRMLVPPPMVLNVEVALIDLPVEPLQ